MANSDDLNDVVKAMADQIRTAIANLNVYPVWPEVVAPDGVLLKMSEEKDDTFGSPGRGTYQIELWVVVSVAKLESAQRRLNTYVSRSGTRSIKAALEADRTLGGTVETIIVGGVKEYSGQLIGGREQLGARRFIDVLVRPN